MSKFLKATKKKRKLRLAIFGASGSGKTMSALRIATGFGGSIAFVDTENSAELYADRFDFDICNCMELNVKPTIDNVVSLMNETGDYKTLIIDSFSHPWKELLEEVSKIATARFGGNTHAAWSQGNPKQNKLIDAILNYPGHLIVCMRSKTEWAIEKDEKTGKVKPKRIGLAPVQGKDIEYEFDMLMEISPEHYATFAKDRTGKFQDMTLEKPGEDFGKQIIEWLNSGKESVSPPPEVPETEEMPNQFADNARADFAISVMDKFNFKEDHEFYWLMMKSERTFEESVKYCKWGAYFLCGKDEEVLNQFFRDNSRFYKQPQVHSINELNSLTDTENNKKLVERLRANIKDRLRERINERSE